MTRQFLTGVKSIVEPVLAELGFQFEEYVDDIDEGGPKAAVVFYRSNDCKIAPLDSANTLGLYDYSAKWQYLVRFALRQGVCAEEIMKDKLPVDFPTTSQWLESVRNRIEKYYPVAHAGVLEMGGPEWWASKP
jgi:hypothetical protein